jgi:hypothetical protein
MPTLENTFTSGALQTPADPYSQSFTVTSAKLILVSVDIGDSTNRTVTSVKWNTTESFTLVKNQDDTQFQSAQIWRLENPTPGTFNIAVDWAVSPVQALVTISGWINGKVSTSTPNGATGATANPSVIVADYVSGTDVLYATYASDVGPDSASTESDTLIGEAENVASDSDFATQYKTGAGTSIGWTASAPISSFWAIAAVSIKPIKVTNVQQPLASLWPILVAG